MMGERDFRSVITAAVDSIGRELDVKIDPEDIGTIHLHEVVRCLRRSYYDRTDPKDLKRGGFNELLSGLLQKYGYGSEPKDFEVDGIRLRGRADMIVDDAVILFRSAGALPEDPKAGDVLFLNACLWIYGKLDGVIVYISGDRQEASFSVTRNKRMFEETVRRVRVLNDLLGQKKLPILEPATECEGCQYYERCFMKQRVGRSFNLKEMIGIDSKEE